MIHLESPVDGWTQAVQRLPGGALVKAFAVQWLAEAKAANPGVRTLHRYWNDGIQQVNPDDTDAVRENRARDWFNRFVDGTFLNGSTAGITHPKAVNLISWWNEFYAGSQTPAEKELWWRQERVAARVWFQDYRNGPHRDKLNHIQLAICAAPVGNDIPWQAAQTAAMYDCVLDYHGYNKYIATRVRDPYSWRYHCGRWVWMDEEFRSRGFTCKWLIGEGGPYEGVETGYRHWKVLDGDVGLLFEDARWFIREIRKTHVYQRGDFLGFVYFTTGGGPVWQWFELRQPTLNGLADVVKQEFLQPPPPPPAPTRDPEPATPGFLIDYVDKLPTVSSPYPFTIRKLADIKSVVIHHSVGSSSTAPEAINTLHQSSPRFYPRIGYHVYVKGDGSAYKTNLFTDRSWHAGPAGNDGIGICMAGDFTNASPTEAQIAVVSKIVQWINDVLGVKPLVKHKDVAATQCPGNTVNTWWARLTEEPVTTWQKTVFLVHPSATIDQYLTICKLAFPTKTEVAFSADAAFARPTSVSNHTVIVYGGSNYVGGPAALLDFAKKYTYSPPTIVEFREFPAVAAGGF